MKISPVLTATPTCGWLTLHLRLMPLTIIPPCMTPMDSDTTRISILCLPVSEAVLQALLHLTASNSSPRSSPHTGLVSLSGSAVTKKDSLMPWASCVQNALHRRCSWNKHLFVPCVCRTLSFPTDYHYLRHPSRRPSPARTICLPCLLLPFVLLIGSARATSYSKKTLMPKARETYITPLTHPTLPSAAQLIQLRPYSSLCQSRLIVADARTSVFQSPFPI